MSIIISLVCFAAFYFGFADIKRGLIDFWINRIPIEKSSDGLFRIAWTFVGLQFLQFSWVFILDAFVSTTPNSFIGFPDGLSGTKLIALMLFSVVIEEIVFRGLFLSVGYAILTFFKRDWSFALGLLSSVLFGLIHLTNYNSVDLSTILWITPQMLAGATFWWTAKRYSFVTAVFYHAMFNLLILIPLIYFG